MCALMLFMPLSINIILSSIGLSFFRKNRILRILFTFYFAFSMAFFAYSFNPPQSFDLYRIFEKATWLKESSLSTIFSIYSGNPEILFNIILYFLATHFSIHFIPAFFSFIGYYLLIYMIVDFCDRKKTKTIIYVMSILIFVLIFNHMLLISGIRNFIAIIFFSFLLYIEKVAKKESIISNLLYIPLLFLHKSMIFFVLLRLLLFFDLKKSIKVVIIISLFLMLVPNILFGFLSKILSNTSLLSSLSTLSNYINNNKDYSTLILLSMFLFYLLCIRLVWFVVKKIELNKFYEFIILALIIIFGIFRYNVLLDRMIFLCTCLFPILLIDYLDILLKSNKYNRKNIILCISFILIIAAFMFRNQLHEYWNYVDDIFSNMNETSIVELFWGDYND